MIPEILMKHFRKNASATAKEYASRYEKTHTKMSVFYFAEHYINEANSKINLLEEIVMPKRKASFNYGSTKFCAVSLDTPAKEEARKWLSHNSQDLDTFAVQMVRDGWKCTFSWDGYNDCFIASSTCRDENDSNYDTCVTSRSDNMWDAMLLNYYKIYVLFSNKTLPTEREKNNWG